jgi:hypothetical protein
MNKWHFNVNVIVLFQILFTIPGFDIIQELLCVIFRHLDPRPTLFANITVKNKGTSTLVRLFVLNFILKGQFEEHWI